LKIEQRVLKIEKSQTSEALMSFLSSVNRRLKRDFFRWRHQHSVRQVVETPVLRRGDMPFMLLSMVHKRDVLPYLVALKSFVQFANPYRVVMVCDPSIGEQDKALIRSHVPHIEFRKADEFVHPDAPRGGCWERLLAISTYSPQDYVVQLDADTITTRDIVEVVDAIRRNAGFVLGEEPRQSLMTLSQTSERAGRDPDGQRHIQGLSEARIAHIGLPSEQLYVRGCAGFTGFPPCSLMRDHLLEFSRLMSENVGAQRWASWGTEQVTSNYLVANAPDTSVLPFPKYGTPDVMNDQTAFLHFIGSMRFLNGKYEKTSRQVIQRLSSPASRPA
jgi:hypothetical protein